jgi:hypothetical protein
LQIIGRKGAVNVKVERTRKGGHITATFAVPARGEILPILWTFKGTDRRSRVPGSLTS